MSHPETSARERRGDKELEQHGQVRALPVAVMATRWSRAHEEIYLRRKMEWRWCLRRREGHDGAVAWTNWLMELGDGGFGSAVSRCPGRRARGGRRGNAKMERATRRAGAGGFKTRLAVPGRSRRVACALKRAATGGATRRQFSESVGHNVH